MEGLYAEESTSARTATDEELAVAPAPFSLVPSDDPRLYARVALLPGPDGPAVIEVEAIEPSLFLDLGDASDTLAGGIAHLPRWSPRRGAGAAPG